MIPQIMLFNPALSTMNVGDAIIFDSIRDEIDAAFPDAFAIEISTHLPLSYRYMRLVLDSKPKIVCGSNILSSSMGGLWFKQWNLRAVDALYLKDLILLGVGWHAYQEAPTRYTKWLLRRILSKTLIHSVRDSHTEQMLRQIGITNVINTGCPTLWTLTPDKCQRIPTEKAGSVVFTLTDYRQSPDVDNEFIRILKRNYRKIYFWVQGFDDLRYTQTLSEFDHNIEIIPPRLDRFDELLDSTTDIEFVGTRLHGGIRTLQHERRAIIIGVDNRALENKTDFKLNVIDRKDLHELEGYLNSSVPTKLELRFDAIEQWRTQLRRLASQAANDVGQHGKRPLEWLTSGTPNKPRWASAVRVPLKFVYRRFLR